MKKIAFLIICVINTFNIFCQDINVNVSSNFIWRGKLISDKVCVQPIMYYCKGDSILSNEIGTFSSFSLDGSYQEVDLYYKINYKCVYLLFTDYILDLNTFTDYSDTTKHIFETTVGFKKQGFPLSASFNTFIWGFDKDSLGKQLNSTYLELNYNYKNINLFCGFNTYKSYYAEHQTIVNIGFSITKNFQFDNITIPIIATLMSNPDTKQLFGNLMITF